MKTQKALMILITTQLALAGNLLAATGAREDTSSFLVWGFLCMCALIVIVQLLPAMMLIFGLVKGMITGNKQVQADLSVANEE
jgi:hypothetical protein